MSTIALFHSALGVRPGVLALADLLRGDGHTVEVVDQYDGRVLDSYEEAGEYVERMGYPALMQRAVEAVTDLSDGFVAAGFSNGAGMAEWVALQRSVSAVVMMSGALPLQMLGAKRWPASVPVQLHYAAEDPFRNQEWVEDVVDSIRESGARLETYLDYPIAGHLFSDPSLPEEYNSASASLLEDRIRVFCSTTA